jgi:hypothetical protein
MTWVIGLERWLSLVFLLSRVFLSIFFSFVLQHWVDLSIWLLNFFVFVFYWIIMFLWLELRGLVDLLKLTHIFSWILLLKLNFCSFPLFNILLVDIFFFFVFYINFHLALALLTNKIVENFWEYWQWIFPKYFQMLFLYMLLLSFFLIRLIYYSCLFFYHN